MLYCVKVHEHPYEYRVEADTPGAAEAQVMAGVKLNWKIDCYERALEYGSPDPGDAEKTWRVLTNLLAEEY